jgi:hypothetical protein
MELVRQVGPWELYDGSGIQTEWRLVNDKINDPLKEGLYHNENGPAIVYQDYNDPKKSYKIWYQYGKYHRTDGKAIEDPFNICDYYIEGRQYITLEDYIDGLVETGYKTSHEAQLLYLKLKDTQ